jgi:uncharacterized protein
MKEVPFDADARNPLSALQTSSFQLDGICDEDFQHLRKPAFRRQAQFLEAEGDEMERTEVTFPSGNGRCVAWLYRPRSQDRAPCIIMAHGFSLTRHDGLLAFAERFAAAGAAVLVFDFRHFGDAPGEPRQLFRIGRQMQDWRSAVAFARTLDQVERDRIVLWGYSMSGGYILQTVAHQSEAIVAAVVLCPFTDGFARVIKTPLRDVAWILPRAIADVLGWHVTIPVAAPPGSHGALSFPGEPAGMARVVGSGSPWQNRITPGVFLTVAMHRPVTSAAKVRCPIWIGAGQKDVTVSNQAIKRLATRAPRAELRWYPYDHFDFFVGDGPALVGQDQVDFLRRVGVLKGISA